MITTLIIQPCIFSDERLNGASQSLGPFRSIIYGKSKTELFKNIREKIAALGVAEAEISDDKLAKEYNLWTARLYKEKEPPKIIENYATAKMGFALPFSVLFKMRLAGKQ